MPCSSPVDGLGKATLALGRQVAPHIRRQGEKFLPKSVTDSSGGQSKLDAVAEVAVGGLQGKSLNFFFSFIYIFLFIESTSYMNTIFL